MNVGNYKFIPDSLVVEWGEMLWKKIRTTMSSFAVVERAPGLCGYIYYEKTND